MWIYTVLIFMNYPWRKLISLLLAVVVLTGCFRKIHYIKKGDVAQTNFYTSFPFEFRMGLIVIKAKINGSATEYEFIFDTGAYMSMVSADLAEELKLRTAGNSKVSDSQKNSRKTRFATIDTMEMGGVKFLNKGALVYPIPENSYFKCIAKDGIIGANIIQDCNWDIDFANKTITISNTTFTPAGATPVKFKNTLSGKPYATFNIAGHKVKNVLIDMGSNGGFDLTKNVVKRRYKTIAKNSFVKQYDGTSQGIWGNSYDTAFLTYIDTAYLGKNKAVAIPQLPLRVKGSTSIKVGLEALINHRIYLNYTNSTIYMVQQFADTTNRVEEGFGFIFNRIEDKVYIGSIYEGSPAWDAGLKVGDEVTEVNGTLPQDNFGDVCSFVDWMVGVLRSEKELKLTVNNQEKLITLKRAAYKKQAYPYLGE